MRLGRDVSCHGANSRTTSLKCEYDIHQPVRFYLWIFWNISHFALKSRARTQTSATGFAWASRFPVLRERPFSISTEMISPGFQGSFVRLPANREDLPADPENKTHPVLASPEIVRGRVHGCSPTNAKGNSNLSRLPPSCLKGQEPEPLPLPSPRNLEGSLECYEFVIRP